MRTKPGPRGAVHMHTGLNERRAPGNAPTDPQQCHYGSSKFQPRAQHRHGTACGLTATGRHCTPAQPQLASTPAPRESLTSSLTHAAAGSGLSGPIPAAAPAMLPAGAGAAALQRQVALRRPAAPALLGCFVPLAGTALDLVVHSASFVHSAVAVHPAPFVYSASLVLSALFVHPASVVCSASWSAPCSSVAPGGLRLGASSGG